MAFLLPNPIHAITGALSPRRYASVLFLQRSFINGLAIGEAKKLLRSAGLGIDNNVASKLYGFFRSEGRSTTIWDTTPRNRLMDPRLMRKAPPTQRRKFRYVIRVDAWSDVLGEKTTQYFSINTSVNRTYNTIEREAQKLIEADPDKYKLRDISIDVLSPSSKVAV